MIILCSCCLRVQPPAGWFATVEFDGVATEHYCTRECRNAHFNAECGCFVLSDSFELLGDERE